MSNPNPYLGVPTIQVPDQPILESPMPSRVPSPTPIPPVNPTVQPAYVNEFQQTVVQAILALSDLAATTQAPKSGNSSSVKLCNPHVFNG